MKLQRRYTHGQMIRLILSRYGQAMPDSPVLVETGCGISTLLLADAGRELNARVICCDINREKIDALRHKGGARLDNVEFLTGDSVTLLEKLATAHEQVHFLHLDAAASALHTLQEFMAIEPVLKKGSTILVDNAALPGEQRLLSPCRKGRVLVPYLLASPHWDVSGHPDAGDSMISACYHQQPAFADADYEWPEYVDPWQWSFDNQWQEGLPVQGELPLANPTSYPVLAAGAVVWLAGYPHSGGSLLRAVLWRCFGIRSGSVYREEPAGNRAQKEYTGHIDQDIDGKIPFAEGALRPVRTHEPPADYRPAIYVVRDGRAAVQDLYAANREVLSPDDVIAGRTRFGAWRDHLQAWRPWQRPRTLTIRYEDMTDSLPAVIDSLERFLCREATDRKIPAQELVAGVLGDYGGRAQRAGAALSAALVRDFEEDNRELLSRYGYL